MNPLIWDEQDGLRSYVPPVRYRRPWRVYATTISLSLLVGLVGGYHVATMQHGVDHEISAAKWQQFEVLKEDYQQRFAKRLRTTKAQAQVHAAKIEQEREQERLMREESRLEQTQP